MIYLIGGPPKCGKTTLAKRLSKTKHIPWVSTDTLQSVINPYINEEDHAAKFPTTAQRESSNDEKYSKYSTDEIIQAYQQQAKTVYQAIDMFALCEMTDGNDFIIEGYHVEPELVAELNAKYSDKIRSIFLVKLDEEKFVRDIQKSRTPNDWIIARTEKEETYGKIAKMICEYGKHFKTEAKKHCLKVQDMDHDFEGQISEAIQYLTI
jgi:2-phosphoglycerate kinase